MRNFTPVKIQRLRPGLNPQSWVPEASMLTTRSPKPLYCACNGLLVDWFNRKRLAKAYERKCTFFGTGNLSLFFPLLFLHNYDLNFGLTWKMLLITCSLFEPGLSCRRERCTIPPGTGTTGRIWNSQHEGWISDSSDCQYLCLLQGCW